MEYLRTDEFADFVKNSLELGKKKQFGNLLFLNSSSENRWATVHSYAMLIAVVDRQDKKIYWNMAAQIFSATTKRHLNSVINAKHILSDYEFLAMEEPFLKKLV